MRTFLTLALLCVSAIPVAAQHRFLANQQRRLAIFDRDGNLEWEMSLKASPHDLHLLPSGNILTHQGTEIVEIDQETKKVVWSLDAKKFASVEKVEVHSVLPISDDQFMIALSGEGKLLEVDRDGALKHTITLVRDHPHPHRDTRLVRRTSDGTYLVAAEGDGKVVWEYEVPMFGKPPRGGHGAEGFGNAVFSAIRLANGNTLIGTGNGHSVLEVSPEKEIVWKIEQNDLASIALAWVTTLEAHPDGSLVIGNCHAGPDQPQLVKVNREKDVLWKFKDFKTLGNAVSNSVILDAPKGVIR